MLLKFSKYEVAILNRILKDMQDKESKEKIRIANRRKAQLKGKTIARLVQKKSKPARKTRVTKKRASIR